LYAEGYWIVILRRVTPSGIGFNDDSIRVHLTERHGPSSLSLWHATEYEESQEKKIAKEKAIELALKNHHIISRNLAYGSEKEVSLTGEPKVMESIVKQSIFQKGEERGPPRHAYIVALQAQTTLGIKPFSVYIDVETGIVIGGYY
jgi:hypothetical protein